MKRMYRQVAVKHFRQNRQMLFLMGPRQVGKTYVGQSFEDGDFPSTRYYSWESETDQREIMSGNTAVAHRVGLDLEDQEPPLLVFDEIHKYSKWKTFLKGLYDVYPFKSHILVTGSARLDVYKRGTDSLMGRYFRYHVHPLSVRELLEPDVIPEEPRPEPLRLAEDQFDALLQFGGFPDPFLRAEERYHRQWQRLRRELLFRNDLRDLTRVREIAQMEVMAELLGEQVGQLVSASSLSRKVGVAHTTVKTWLNILESLFYIFPVRPWTKNVSRSLLKEPKYYMWDWSLVSEPAARAENFIASHLLKCVNFWNDHGVGEFGLYFVRDRNQREVDFLVTRDRQPWLLIEVKKRNSSSISSALHYFSKSLQPDHALQVVLQEPYHEASCFLGSAPRVVSARSFLSQLV